jgi:hypothetical protein
VVTAATWTSCDAKETGGPATRADPAGVGRRATAVRWKRTSDQSRRGKSRACHRLFRMQPRTGSVPRISTGGNACTPRSLSQSWPGCPRSPFLTS